MSRFQGMRHIALRVTDVERSAQFYEKAFGMRRFGPTKAGGDLIPLVSPNLKDQISLSSASSSGETNRELGLPGESGGIDHFGFILSPRTNMDRMRQHLEACGAEFLGRHDVHERAPSMFFKDPDGYVFQITRFPRFTRLFIAAQPFLTRRQKRAARATAGAAAS